MRSAVACVASPSQSRVGNITGSGNEHLSLWQDRREHLRGIQIGGNIKLYLLLTEHIFCFIKCKLGCTKRRCNVYILNQAMITGS